MTLVALPDEVLSMICRHLCVEELVRLHAAFPSSRLREVTGAAYVQSRPKYCSTPLRIKADGNVDWLQAFDDACARLSHLEDNFVLEHGMWRLKQKRRNQVTTPIIVEGSIRYVLSIFTIFTDFFTTMA